MSTKDNIDILNKFLDATTAEAVDSVLADSEFFKNVEWVQIGGKKVAEEVNAGRVEGQMKYPENAFVEKITNSIDAILMKKCRERGIEPTDRNKAPKSLQEAIVKFIGTELYIENLFIKERRFIASTTEPLWYFKPIWISDTELEYELPSGEKKIYKIK